MAILDYRSGERPSVDEETDEDVDPVSPAAQLVADVIRLLVLIAVGCVVCTWAYAMYQSAH